MQTAVGQANRSRKCKTTIPLRAGVLGTTFQEKLTCALELLIYFRQ